MKKIKIMKEKKQNKKFDIAMGLNYIEKYNQNTNKKNKLYHSKIPRIDRKHTEVGTAGNYVQDYLTPCDNVVIKHFSTKFLAAIKNVIYPHLKQL